MRFRTPITSTGSAAQRLAFVAACKCPVVCSGYLGSGVCVFSRFPVVDTLMHRYSLNGFAHHVHRGDWFGGKVVGMVRIKLNGFLLNFYSSHVSAYSPLSPLFAIQ